MNKLIIIGNGFDIAHGLKTTFDDFIKYSSNYPEKYSLFKNSTNCWYSAEDQFKYIVSEKLIEIGSEVYVDEEVEKIYDDYGTDENGEMQYYDYRANAFKEDIEVISKIVLLLVSFEKDFLYYLKDKYNDFIIYKNYKPFSVLKKIFDDASKIINFNYTNVIEIVYGIKDVEHIHGNVNDDILIGCDTFDRLNTSFVHSDYPSSKMTGSPKDVLIERMKYYEHDFEGNLVERTQIKRFFDDVVEGNKSNEEELYYWLKMKSKEHSKARKEIMDSLLKEEFDEVHIIGHSLGQADWKVINAINSKKITCYFHDKNDYDRKFSYIEQNGWNIALKQDIEIFC